ncbi:MAG: c-type cytochrome [Chlorobi bacterium]|nr:c-type cytochrome [Chlorobiota bacterium]
MKKTILLLFIAGLVLASCNHYPEKTYWDYMGEFDMYYSKAYESYSPNPHLPGGMTLQPMPEGTVPRDGEVPYPFKNKLADRKLAGQKLKNPLPKTPENLERGQMMYNIYCAVCHGKDGKGMATADTTTLYKKKLYPIPPADLTTDLVRSYPDGEIYHVITMGSAIMGPHGSQIRPADRWRIVHYIKNGFKVK